MGLGPSKVGAFTALIPCLPMFFSTWETYHTHTLYLGYVNGPTEGLLVAIAVMLFSGYYGPHLWHSKVADHIGFADLFGDHTFLDFWISVILFSFFTAHLPACVYNVAVARKRQGLAVLPTLLEWTPIVVFTASIVAWVSSPYSILLRDNHLVLFCVILSFVFGRMTTKIILAHLLRQRFPYWTVLLTPLVVGAALTNLPRLGLPPFSPHLELAYLWAYLAFAATAYMHWSLLVINRITTFLGINCLTIRTNKASARDQAYRSFGDAGNGGVSPNRDLREKSDFKGN
jgi:ethanolaminephosphotransferase